MIADELQMLAVCVLGYLFGSVPFGLLLTKVAGLGDIRGIGSGNIGATNVLRTGRKGLAAATLLLDGLKGVATGLGVLIAAAWPVGLVACVVWLVVAAASRRSSLAALASFASAPIVALILEDFSVVKLAFTIAVLVFVRHQANIRRLIAGTEPRIGQGNTERA